VLTCGWPVSVGLVRDVTSQLPASWTDRSSVAASGRQLSTLYSICLSVSSLSSVSSTAVDVCGSTFHPCVVFTVRRGKARRDRSRDDAPSLDAQPIVRLISSRTVASVCISTNLQTERHVCVHFIPPSSAALAHNGPFLGSCPIPLFAKPRSR
jgi:hypothetical protein